MASHERQLGRPTALKKGGLVATALAVGVPALSATAGAINTDVVTMNVDVPPTISSNRHGRVVTAIYPGGDIGPDELEAEASEGNRLGFKLGPDDEDIEFDAGDVEDHADSVGARLVYNGVHGSHVMGVFFDSSTATDWFGPDDDEAKLSAVELDEEGNPVEMVAWGSDDVNVR